jgi:hypothetical protein
MENPPMTQHDPVASRRVADTRAPFSLLPTAQAPCAAQGLVSVDPCAELPPPPWQPLDPVAYEWALLALCAQSAPAYSAAGRVLLALAWEESARVSYAAACGVRDHGGTRAIVPHLEQALHDLTQAWRDWQSVLSWMQDPRPRMQVRPFAELSVACQKLWPTCAAGSTDCLPALRASAETHHQRLTRLFTHVEQEYLLVCERYHLSPDHSWLPGLLPAPQPQPAHPSGERQGHA